MLLVLPRSTLAFRELPLHAFYEIYLEKLPPFFSSPLRFHPNAQWLLLTGVPDYGAAREILNAVVSIGCQPEEKVISTNEFGSLGCPSLSSLR